MIHSLQNVSQSSDFCRCLQVFLLLTPDAITDFLIFEYVNSSKSVDNKFMDLKAKFVLWEKRACMIPSCSVLSLIANLQRLHRISRTDTAQWGKKILHQCMLLHHYYSSFLCTMFMISSELKSFQNLGTHITWCWKFKNLQIYCNI